MRGYRSTAEVKGTLFSDLEIFKKLPILLVHLLGKLRCGRSATLTNY